MGRGRSY